MSDYDDDELPSISVNALDAEHSGLEMPDAAVLASQRAEEAARDAEVLRRREALRAGAGGCAGAGEAGVAAALLHDSSGSEGEGALAATLLSLKVAAAECFSPGAPLLRVLAEGAPPGAVRDTLADMCAELSGSPEHTDTVLERLVQCISRDLRGAGAGDAAGAGEDAALAAACCVCACARSGRRTLQHALDNVATPHQAELVSQVLCGAVGGGGERGGERDAAVVARRGLQLHGRLRSGSGGGADTCARRVLAATLRAVLGDPQAEDSSCELSEHALCSLLARGWRELDTRAQHLTVQLLARWRVAAGAEAGAAEAPGAGGGLAAALDALEPRSRDKHHPDALKVLVGIAKLKLLTRTEA